MLTILNLLQKDAPDDMSNQKRVIRDTGVEFLATTIFVYFGTLSAVSTGQKLVGSGGSEDVARILPIAFTFGITIMSLAYAIGHITGGHMNPGVSLTMFFQLQMSLPKMICYWVAQLTGALLGASLMWGSCSELAGSTKGELGTYNRPPFDLGSTTLSPAVSSWNGFLLELMGSYFFYLVISQTALDKKGIAQSFMPAIPIGFSLIVVHICLIPFTGCGVNPARTFGPSMVVCMAGNCDNVVDDWYWIYYAGPFLASLLVAETTHWLQWDVDAEEDTGATSSSSDAKKLEISAGQTKDDEPEEVVENA